MRLVRVLVSAIFAAAPSLLALLLSLPALAQESPNLENGLKAYGTYDETALDTISLSNGNLALHVPLPFSYAQRGGKLGAAYYLVQNSKAWSVQWIPIQTGQFYFWSYGWRGLVSTALTTTNAVSFQRTYVTTVDGSNNVTGEDSGYFLMTWDGATHQLTSTGAGTFETIDTTGFRVVSSNPDNLGVPSTFVVTDRNGNVYSGNHFANTGPCARVRTGGVGGTTTTTCQEIAGFSTETDANGNFLSGGLDTLGRTGSPAGVTIVSTAGCVSSLPLSSAYTENFVGPTGTAEQVKMCFGTLTFQTAFGQPGVTESQSTGSGGLKSISPLVDMVLPNGTQWTFNYDSYGNITFVGLPTGGSISYTWTTASFPDCSGSNTLRSRAVASRTLTDGTTSHTWNYVWGTQQANGSITNVVTDPLGNDTVHTFSPIGAACNFFETATLSYSGSHTTGQLLKSIATTYSGSAFQVETVTGNSGGNVVPTAIVTTDLLSGQVSQTLKSYDPGLGTNQPIFGIPITQKDYDWGVGSPGALLREVDTTYLFQNDARYLTAQIVELPASIVTKDGSGNRIAETDYTYDEPAYLTSSGITTQHGAAPAAVRGNPTTVSRWLNTGSPVVSHTNWYDTGKIYQSIDPLGHATTFAYSGTFLGAYPTTVTNALGQFYTQNFDFSTGLVTSKTDLNSLVTSYTYDSMWRLASVTRPDGGGDTITHQESSFPFSATQNTKLNTSTTKSDTNLFDGLGRLTQTQLTSDPQGTVFSDTTYDAIGRVATVSNPHRVCGTDPTSSCGVTTYTYDALSRKIRESYPDGSALTTAYCGASTLVTDPTKRWRRSRADGLGRLVEVDEPNAVGASVASTGCPGTGEATWITSYTYDVLGNLTNVLQNGSRPRSFTYDSLSRLLTSTNPEVGALTYTYNPDGPVHTKTDARSIVTTYTYDPLHRELTRTYSNNDPTVTTTYDQSACLGLSACQNIGHRTSMTDAAGSESWAYGINKTQYPDSPNISVDKRTTGSITKTGTYYADLAGNATTFSYPTGRTIYAVIDKANRNIEVYNGPAYAAAQYPASPGCLINVVCYTPQGTIYSMSLYHSTGFNGLNILETYNTRLQPQEIKASSSGGNAMDLTYNFVDPINGGNAGHVFGITNNLDTTRSQTFTYDQVNRITAAQTTSTFATSPSHCWAETYQFDNSPTGGAWGNLTQLTQPANSPYTGCTYEIGFSKTVDANNHLSGFSYDASGNTSADGYNSYTTWNAESQLTVVGSSTYLYDGDGRRVAKANTAVPPVPNKLYWYGPHGEILGETDGSGNTLNEYVFLGGRRIAMLPAGANPILYVEDKLGTSRINTTSTGVVCYDADFYPYGGERVPYTDTCTQNNYKFEGKERDGETGNDDFGARYYSNRFGRWLSADWSNVPVAVPYANLTNPQTLNLYSMVADDPESFADLDGHCCDGITWNDIWHAGAAIGSAIGTGVELIVGSGAAAVTTLAAPSVVAVAIGYNVPVEPQGNLMLDALNPPNDFRGMVQNENTGEQGRDAQGKFLPKQPGESNPGSAGEKEGLASEGATKNTKPIPGTNRVPDGKKPDGQYVEVKSGGSVNNTKQLQESGKGAVDASGKPLVVVTTNPNVKVSKPAQQNPNLVIKPIKPSNQ
jgi:RHS repeat-associated protein